MKKILVSIIIIGSFSLYVLFHKQKDTATLPPAASPSAAPTNSGNTTTTAGKYKDGVYTGPVEDAFYGNVQVKAIVQNGHLVDVQFLQYPNDQHESVEINTRAMPLLKQQAIQSQSAVVDSVTRATDTTAAFRRSLGAALAQAQ